MLHESPHLRVTANDGVATLWLGFPGKPVNALNLARLAEVNRALSTVAKNPSIEVLVLRSARPGGFCAGYESEIINELRTDSEASQLALAMQKLGQRIVEAPFVSLAFLEGPCLGPGFDLALACDYRLAVAGPESQIGFGFAPTGGGGATRLGTKKAARFHGAPLYPREAVKLGGIDQACCERRAKIELQTWLDRLQANPRKRNSTFDPVGFAAERTSFQRAVQFGYPELEIETFDPLPESITVNEKRLAIEYAIRGVQVTLEQTDFRSPASTSEVQVPASKNLRSRSRTSEVEILSELDFTHRGRLTPLEASQAMKRITVVPAPKVVPVHEYRLEYAA